MGNKNGQKEERFYYPISSELGGEIVGYVLLTHEEAMDNKERLYTGVGCPSGRVLVTIMEDEAKIYYEDSSCVDVFWEKLLIIDTDNPLSEKEWWETEKPAWNEVVKEYGMGKYN